MLGVLARWWVPVSVLGWILIWILGVYGLVVAGQPQGFSVSCPLSATDQERIECSFGIGPETMIVFHPQSTACQIMTQELLGKSIRLRAVVEP